MVTRELLTFVRSSLPEPPARVLEIGAGDGALAAALEACGYEVTPIDPAAQPDGPVRPEALIQVDGSFDAAVAVTSLHHVDPLEASCDHLAELLGAGARLVIDEFDINRYDERATRWWLGQRYALGFGEEGRDPAGVLEDLRHHVHPLGQIQAALRPHFDLGEPIRGPFLYRWWLPESLLAAEVELIAEGQLPAVGCRLVATRKA
jgi:SAM-dependent methyltransferase